MDERIESLCVRLGASADPLARPGPMHELAVRIADDIRAGAPDVAESLDTLEDQLLEAGFAAGLSPARTAYTSIPGLGGGRPGLWVLACPAGRCGRVAPPADPPPTCAVLRRPLTRLPLDR